MTPNEGRPFGERLALGFRYRSSDQNRGGKVVTCRFRHCVDVTTSKKTHKLSAVLVPFLHRVDLGWKHEKRNIRWRTGGQECPEDRP